MFFTGPAAARLFDDHVDALHRYAARRVGEDVAVTVVAGTFSAAVHSDGPPGSTTELERGWLLAIASHLLREHDALERERLSNWQHAPAARLDPLDPLVTADGHEEEVDEVMRAVADLPPEDRDLLFLLIWERYPTSTVARVLGMPSGAVTGELKRVRRELRRRLARRTASRDVQGRTT